MGQENKLAQAIFSKEGPYLNKPDVTSNPNVTPNKYKDNNKKIRGIPSTKTETQIKEW